MMTLLKQKVVSSSNTGGIKIMITSSNTGGVSEV